MSRSFDWIRLGWRDPLTSIDTFGRVDPVIKEGSVVVDWGDGSSIGRAGTRAP